MQNAQIKYQRQAKSAGCTFVLTLVPPSGPLTGVNKRSRQARTAPESPFPPTHKHKFNWPSGDGMNESAAGAPVGSRAGRTDALCDGEGPPAGPNYQGQVTAGPYVSISRVGHSTPSPRRLGPPSAIRRVGCQAAEPAQRAVASQRKTPKPSTMAETHRKTPEPSTPA